MPPARRRSTAESSTTSTVDMVHPFAILIDPDKRECAGKVEAGQLVGPERPGLGAFMTTKDTNQTKAATGFVSCRLSCLWCISWFDWRRDGLLDRFDLREVVKSPVDFVKLGLEERPERMDGGCIFAAGMVFDLLGQLDGA